MVGHFDWTAAEHLPPHQKSQDHAIQLEPKADGSVLEVPWGSLYAMSQNELLVLCNTLNGLLDKEFIQVSQSSTAASVLFVKKPGGGLQFCVNYCGLNKITRKDHYSLPLIQETLNSISKAKFFTKLDVIATFHKIRVEEEDDVAVRTIPLNQVRLIGSTGLDSGLVLAERSVKEQVGVLRDSACGLL